MSAVASQQGLRHELMDRIHEARRRTDELFEIVRPEARYDRPIPERHRIIFYRGHLEAFDWNLMRERLFGRPAFDANLDRLFAFGIDPVGGGLPTDQPSDWPREQEVRDYVEQVRQAIDGDLDALLSSDRVGSEFSPELLLNVAIEHRLMHAETLAYMLHQLPHDRKISPGPQSRVAAAPHSAGMIRIPAGKATLGLSRATGEFGWDNEFEMHTVNVPEFSVDRFKVTNGEFLEFLQAGGYQNSALWRDDDWQWVSSHAISHPAFWRRDGGGWLFRGMFGEVSLPLDSPVYVSHAEAEAYARWKGKALPTEEQWHRAAYGTPDGTERAFPWGDASPSRSHGNFDFSRWEPTPTSAFEAGNSAWGVSDLLGNGWEWTSSLFAPFAGFERFSFYPGYSADFFGGKHFVLKGGSARTASCMLRRSFRNWFQPHYQYVYAGFRCVSS